MRREADTRAKAFGDIGADLKYSVTPSLTLDLTLNTDFAQVEVDEEQINLDRFNLFFPEKRPFFLENAGPVLGWSPRAGRGLLQSAHWHRRGRRAGPDHRRRAPVR